MQNIIVTNALYWKNYGEMPCFVSVPIQYENGEMIVHVKVAMFGKTLYRAITIGHPKIKPPRVLGTLLSGDIVSENPYYPVGTRIVINPHSVDKNGKKVSIFPGAISQFVKVEGPIEKALYPIPDEVDYSSAVYCELIACALESIFKIRDTSKLIIIGCGLMALIQIQIAKHWGIENVYCIYNHPERRNTIRKFGGIPVEFVEDDELDKSKLMPFCEWTDDFAIIDSAGTKKSLEFAFKLAGANCKVVLFAGYPIGTALPIDANDLHYRNCQIMGSYHFDECRFDEALELLKQGIIDIKSLITGEVNWENYGEILTNFLRCDNISNIVVFD